MAAVDNALNVTRGSSLPPRPGTYVLFLRLPQQQTLTVGRLGRFTLPAGLYAYVGSGRGAGGLAARVARHLRYPKPLHWHVDYVRAVAKPTAVWWSEGSQRRECVWAAALSQLAGATLPIPGFGSSDCRCPAHLFRFPAMPGLTQFAQAVAATVSEVRLDDE